MSGLLPHRITASSVPMNEMCVAEPIAILSFRTCIPLSKITVTLLKLVSFSSPYNAYRGEEHKESRHKQSGVSDAFLEGDTTRTDEDRI